MNPEAQEYLNQILTKSPDSLTPDEIGFLKARKSYLKPIHLEEYKSVLEPNLTKETVKKDAKQTK